MTDSGRPEKAVVGVLSDAEKHRRTLGREARDIKVSLDMYKVSEGGVMLECGYMISCQ